MSDCFFPICKDSVIQKSIQLICVCVLKSGEATNPTERLVKYLFRKCTQKITYIYMGATKDFTTAFVCIQSKHGKNCLSIESRCKRNCNAAATVAQIYECYFMFPGMLYESVYIILVINSSLNIMTQCEIQILLLTLHCF